VAKRSTKKNGVAEIKKEEKVGKYPKGNGRVAMDASTVIINEGAGI